MVVVFPFGTCAICEAGLPPGYTRSRPRVVCDDSACMSEVRRFAARRRAAIARRKAAEATSKWCAFCGVDHPRTDEFYYRQGNRLDAWCKKDRLARHKARREANIEKYRARARELAAEARRLETPEQREARRARDREREAAAYKRNPEPFRERSRRYRKRVNRDAKRRQARIENRRMYARLRTEQKSGRLSMRPPMPGRNYKDGSRDDLRCRPLGALVALEAAKRDLTLAEMAALCGLNEKQVYDWRHNFVKTRLAVGERVLIALDMVWWDVFDKAEWPDGLFSGQRSRDVVAWADAMYRAVIAFEG